MTRRPDSRLKDTFGTDDLAQRVADRLPLTPRP